MGPESSNWPISTYFIIFDDFQWFLNPLIVQHPVIRFLPNLGHIYTSISSSYTEFLSQIRPLLTSFQQLHNFRFSLRPNLSTYTNNFLFWNSLLWITFPIPFPLLLYLHTIHPTMISKPNCSGSLILEQLPIWPLTIIGFMIMHHMLCPLIWLMGRSSILQA